jgi:hypothetical protein
VIYHQCCFIFGVLFRILKVGCLPLFAFPFDCVRICSFFSVRGCRATNGQLSRVILKCEGGRCSLLVRNNIEGHIDVKAVADNGAQVKGGRTSSSCLLHLSENSKQKEKIANITRSSSQFWL